MAHDYIYRDLNRTTVYSNLKRRSETDTDFEPGITLHDIIRFKNPDHLSHFPSDYFPLSYEIKNNNDTPITYIYPVKAITIDQQKGYNLFAILKDDFSLVPTVGSSNGIFLARDGWIISIFMYGKNPHTATINYIARLDKLSIKVTDIEMKHIQTENGITTGCVRSFAIESDEAAARYINREWFHTGFEDTASNNYIRYGETQKLHSDYRIENRFITDIYPKYIPFIH